MIFMKGNFQKFVIVCVVVLMVGMVQVVDKLFVGVMFNFVLMNDQFLVVLVQIVLKFKEVIGVEIKVDIMDYGLLLIKMMVDFVGYMVGYDFIIMDIVWVGQFVVNGYMVDLIELMKCDVKDFDSVDIYLKFQEVFGNYKGKQVVYFFVGYVNVFVYCKDFFDVVGLKVLEMMEDLVVVVYKLIDLVKK